MVTPRLPRAARRAQLIEVAARVFLERGFEATTMEEVAQAAGVSRLIVYRIFESKEKLYRAVLRNVLIALGEQFAGLDLETIRLTGATHIVLPVARAQPDAFRLLARHASREPAFADVFQEFRGYVTTYARGILATYLTDELILHWAADTAGAHLVEALCTWLDVGDPARDREFADLMTSGLRGLATAWRGSG
jgi:AcrR family transcriptional regulator